MRDFERIDQLQKEVKELREIQKNTILSLLDVFNKMKEMGDDETRSLTSQLACHIVSTAFGEFARSFNKRTNKGNRLP